MAAMKLKDLQEDTYFTLRPIENPKKRQTYRREYYHNGGKYWAVRQSDRKWVLFEGDTDVYIDFVF